MLKKLIRYSALLMVSTLTACGNSGGTTTFGGFSYKGHFLKEYATNQITVEKAKTLVNINPQPVKKINYLKGTHPETYTDNLTVVLEKFGSLTTIVKYYISDKAEQQVRTDLYQGTDFKSLLESNRYEPFAQMSVRYLFVDDYLLDNMEEYNTNFLASPEHLASPFKVPFTYHTNEDKKLIVQTHSFAELPASINGGIGSTFRQDSELIFDEEGKISLWQSSLGLYTSTPTGTVKEGYIFEVEFTWNSK